MSEVKYAKTCLTAIYRELINKRKDYKKFHKFYVLVDCITTVMINDETIYVTLKQKYSNMIHPFIQAIKLVYNIDIEPITITKGENINIIWDESSEKKIIDDFLEGKIDSINLNGNQLLMNYLYSSLINRLMKKEFLTFGIYNGCLKYGAQDTSCEEFSIIYETILDEIEYRLSRKIEYKSIYEIEEFLYAYFRCIQIGNNNLKDDDINFENWYKIIKWSINNRYSQEQRKEMEADAGQYFSIEPKVISHKKKTINSSLSKVLSLPEQ